MEFSSGATRRDLSWVAVLVGAVLIVLSGVLARVVTSEWAQDWLERHPSLIYSKAVCGSYPVGFFLVGGGLCIAGVVAVAWGLRRAPRMSRWVGVPIIVLGIVALLGWAFGFLSVHVLSSCEA